MTPSLPQTASHFPGSTHLQEYTDCTAANKTPNITIKCFILIEFICFDSIDFIAKASRSQYWLMHLVQCLNILKWISLILSFLKKYIIVYVKSVSFYFPNMFEVKISFHFCSNCLHLYDLGLLMSFFELRDFHEFRMR